MARSRTVAGILFGLAVPAAVIAATPWLPGTSAEYHRWRMTTNYDAIYSHPLPRSGGGVKFVDWGEFGPAYEYHRQQLVRLGAITELQYTFMHLKARTDEGKHFVRLWVGERDATTNVVTRKCPELIDAMSPHPPEPEPLQFTVWCENDRAEEWRRFIAEHDVVDYRARFLSAK